MRGDNKLPMPTRIIDLHTHLFNARYVPLANIIANTMGKDESLLATWVAKLLVRLTGSSYPEARSAQIFGLPSNLVDDATAEILNTLEFELRGTTRVHRALWDAKAEVQEKAAIQAIFDSDLYQIVDMLDGLVPDAQSTKKFSDVSDVVVWARGVVRRAIEKTAGEMLVDAWGQGEDYIEFFHTMLQSEERLVAKVFAGYGSELPPLTISHYMMDMELAYEKPQSPYYAFWPVQLDRMQTLQRRHPGRVISFAAFDPRRKNWKEIATCAKQRGFVGFKFYPALGYRASGSPVHQDRIDEFFEHCIAENMAVFTHCTPVGFQTRKKEGWNAHPKHWADALAKHPKLRLCFGHAGGGDASNGSHHSFGWMAKSPDQWCEADNFARIVAELCVNYENVYCEIGYINQILANGGKKVFIANLERARAKKGTYDFMTKLAYGSDWHMPSMVDNTREYLGAYLDIFRRTEYRQFMEQFFWINARTYLKLP